MLWMSKAQIRENRVKAHEESLKERTRELVKAQLIEQAVAAAGPQSGAIKNRPEVLIQQAHALRMRLDEIMSSSKEEILNFLTSTNYNWITDCQEVWKDLPPRIQVAAEGLGYTQELWDDPSHSSPVTFDLTWEELSADQQASAETLGYSESSWNAAFDDEDDGALLEGSTAPTAPAASGGELEYDWSQVNRDSESSSTSSDEAHGPESSAPMVSDSDSEEVEGGDMQVEYNWDEPGSDPDSSSSASSEASDEQDVIHTYKYPSPSSPMQANPKEDLDDDENEFISNFLSGNSTPRRRSTLQSRYVPSDDEFEFDDLDDGDEEATAKASSTVASFWGVGNASEEDRSQESSPLLGHKPSREAPSIAETSIGGLFRRGTVNNTRTIPPGNDELIIPKAHGHSTTSSMPTTTFALSHVTRVSPTLLASVLLLSLALLWFAVQGVAQ